jgi:hypothetical protein
MAKRISLGPYIYLFTDDVKKGDKLIISAHGGYYYRPLSGNRMVSVPDWTTLHFYVRHGATLSMNVNNGLPWAMQGRLKIHQSVNSGQSVNDYHLSQYQDSIFGETFDNIKSDIDRDRQTNSGARYDVLAMHYHGHFWKFTTLAFVLRELKSRGYEYDNIYCSFCRSQKNRMFGAPDHRAENI